MADRSRATYQPEPHPAPLIRKIVQLRWKQRLHRVPVRCASTSKSSARSPMVGGWRHVGRQQGRRNRPTTPAASREPYSKPLIGSAFVHTMIDGHSRVAHDGFVLVDLGAVAWYAVRGARATSAPGGEQRGRVRPHPRGR